VLAKSDTARLFFAAWPPPEVQRSLGKLAERLQLECGGRALPAPNIHLTLVFLGDVARELLPRLETAAARVFAPPFDLAISRIAYWRHNRVVWAGVESVPAALRVLVNRLEEVLTEEGFRFDQRAYAPHITLLRNARRSPADANLQTEAWPVRRFALVESVPRARGRVYEVLREWPLSMQMSA
jgi:RNA 2',3'-cyclic 3'-phosphodiesterase